MTREEFMKKWGDRLPPPREELERDVDSVMRWERMRIVEAIREASKGSRKYRDVLIAIAGAVEHDQWTWGSRRGLP